MQPHLSLGRSRRHQPDKVRVAGAMSKEERTRLVSTESADTPTKMAEEVHPVPPGEKSSSKRGSKGTFV